MRKTFLNIGKAFILISMIVTVTGLFMTRNPRSFELGAALGFYGFLMFLVSAVVTFIAKIVTSQRG